VAETGVIAGGLASEARHVQRLVSLVAISCSWCAADASTWCVSQAQQYAALRKPYLINDILESNTLLDRRSVYRRLQVPHLKCACIAYTLRHCTCRPAEQGARCMLQSHVGGSDTCACLQQWLGMAPRPQLLYHSILQDSGIPVPNHIIVNRDEGGRDPPGFEETEDYVSLNGGCL
jgi:hypothetical protein